MKYRCVGCIVVLNSGIVGAQPYQLVGYSWDTGDLWSVDATTGKATYLHSVWAWPDSQLVGIDYGPDGHLYGVGSRGEPEGPLLYRIDAATGNAEHLPLSPTDYFMGEGDITFDPQGGLLYTLAFGRGSTTLLTIDIASGEVGEIGSLGPVQDYSALAFDGRRVALLTGRLGVLAEGRSPVWVPLLAATPPPLRLPVLRGAVVWSPQPPRHHCAAEGEGDGVGGRPRVMAPVRGDSRSGGSHYLREGRGCLQWWDPQCGCHYSPRLLLLFDYSFSAAR